MHDLQFNFNKSISQLLASTFAVKLNFLVVNFFTFSLLFFFFLLYGSLARSLNTAPPGSLAHSYFYLDELQAKRHSGKAYRLQRLPHRSGPPTSGPPTARNREKVGNRRRRPTAHRDRYSFQQLTLPADHDSIRNHSG